MDLPIQSPQIDPAQMMALAKHGSPFVLNAVGRLVGLGENEQKAVVSGKVPWWTWAGFGLALGFIVGARVERMHSGRLPEALAGKVK